MWTTSVCCLMSDVVSRETRSRMMSGIRASDTKPELLIRKGLHSLGFRYRLHDRSLPGNPDIVFGPRRAAIFVHGCFWHAHECGLFKWPRTRPEWWKDKLMANRRRDSLVRDQIRDIGWRQLVIWECAIRGTGRRDLAEVMDITRIWISDSCVDEEITGLQ